MPGDSVIATGMVAYGGPFTSKFRQRLESLWISELDRLNLVHSSGVSMRSVLGIPVVIQFWNLKELP